MTHRKRLKSIKELPEWFDITKYQNLSDLDEIGWYEQVVQRSTHNAFMPDYINLQKGTTMEIFYNALIDLRENPLLVIEGRELASLIGGTPLYSLKYNQEAFVNLFHAISPITLDLLYQHERRLKAETRKRMREYIDHCYSTKQYSDIPKEEHEWARDIMHRPIFDVLEDEHVRNQRERNYDIAMVNLSLPDKVLEQQFSEYLRTKRKQSSKFTSPTASKFPEFSKWIEFGVLPYLDLYLWAREENAHIPNRVYADAVLPKGEKGEETIRKTTQKIASEIIGFEYVRYLDSVVANVITEQKYN